MTDYDRFSVLEPWQADEIRLLGTTIDREIARTLGRSLSSVRTKRARLRGRSERVVQLNVSYAGSLLIEEINRCRMGTSKPGNGSGKFDVGAHDMGGWVRVVASNSPATPDDLGAFLADRLSRWLQEHPNLSLVCVVPITKNGNTVELHAWYE